MTCRASSATVRLSSAGRKERSPSGIFRSSSVKPCLVSAQASRASSSKVGSRFILRALLSRVRCADVAIEPAVLRVPASELFEDALKALPASERLEPGVRLEERHAREAVAGGLGQPPDGALLFPAERLDAGDVVLRVVVVAEALPVAHEELDLLTGAPRVSFPRRHE